MTHPALAAVEERADEIAALEAGPPLDGAQAEGAAGVS